MIISCSLIFTRLNKKKKAFAKHGTLTQNCLHQLYIWKSVKLCFIVYSFHKHVHVITINVKPPLTK